MANYPDAVIKNAKELLHSPNYKYYQEIREQKKQRDNKRIIEIVDERMQRFNNLRKPNLKNISNEACKLYKFPKKQKKLLLALSSKKSMSVANLKQITESSSIRSLVRETNKRMQKCKGMEALRIKSCRPNLKGCYELTYLQDK